MMIGRNRCLVKMEMAKCYLCEKELTDDGTGYLFCCNEGCAENIMDAEIGEDFYAIPQNKRR